MTRYGALRWPIYTTREAQKNVPLDIHS